MQIYIAMKVNATLLKHLLILFSLVFSALAVNAQCEPMGPEECPDPENNGEICPDTMPVGYLNQAYAEAATILVPEEDSTGVLIHHLTLRAIDNLPSGLSWVSNAANNEFMAGNYYCVLLEGTPLVADTFYLRIVIDVYIDLLGNPVLITQVVDSTSLSMIIREEYGIDDHDNGITGMENYPNPFREKTSIQFSSKEESSGSIEIYSLHGIKIHEQDIMISRGENSIGFDGAGLPAGTYCYLVKSLHSFSRGIMVKTK